MVYPTIVWTIVDSTLKKFNEGEGKGVTTKWMTTATMSTQRIILLWTMMRKINLNDTNPLIWSIWTRMAIRARSLIMLGESRRIPRDTKSIRCGNYGQ